MNDNNLFADSGKFESLPHWLLFNTEVTPLALRLYLVIRKYGNSENRSWPSRKTLAADIGCSVATVDRAKTELIAVGALCERHRYGSAGGWTSNLYHLHWHKTLDCAGTKTGDSWIESDDPTLMGDSTLPSQVIVPTLTDESTPTITGDELTNTQLEPIPNELIPANAEAQRLCNLLADLIVGNGSKRPNVSKAWIADMERLHRIDGRSWEQMEAAIRWCQEDTFWRGNILSPSKLRAKYDQLRLAAQRTQQKESAFARNLRFMNNLEQKELGQ